MADIPFVSGIPANIVGTSEVQVYLVDPMRCSGAGLGLKGRCNFGRSLPRGLHVVRLLG